MSWKTIKCDISFWLHDYDYVLSYTESFCSVVNIKILISADLPAIDTRQTQCGVDHHYSIHPLKQLKLFILCTVWGKMEHTHYFCCGFALFSQKDPTNPKYLCHDHCAAGFSLCEHICVYSTGQLHEMLLLLLFLLILHSKHFKWLVWLHVIVIINM